METKELLRNEKVERVLSPHPFSFIKELSLCLFLIIWGILAGWIVNFGLKDMFMGNDWYPIVLWGIVMLLFGVIVSLIMIKWTTFILYLAVFLAGTIIMVSQKWIGASRLFIPAYTLAVSIVGLVFVDAYRRTHKYIITNQRIKMMGGIFTKGERLLNYNKILEFNSKQGIMGQIFDFGTIIPVTQSDFGLEDIKVTKQNIIKGKGKKGRQKQAEKPEEEKPSHTPMPKSYFELHGVYPYKEAKNLVEKLYHNAITPLTPYQKEQADFLKEQVDIQKEMKELVSTQTKKTKKQPVVAVKESEEEEESGKEQAFEPEQLDIQKEMKELLKKQSGAKDEKENEETDEEKNS